MVSEAQEHFYFIALPSSARRFSTETSTITSVFQLLQEKGTEKGLPPRFKALEVAPAVLVISQDIIT